MTKQEDAATTQQAAHAEDQYERDWREITGEPFRFGEESFALVHPDDRARFLAAVERGAESGEFVLEYRLRVPDGSYARVRSDTYRTAGGRWLGGIRRLPDCEDVPVAPGSHLWRALVGRLTRLRKR